MLWTPHLTDDELLLTADTELRLRGGRATGHLERCARCRLRYDALQQSLNALEAICRPPEVRPLLSSSASRARLQLRLAALSHAESSLAPAFPFSMALRWMPAAGLMALLVTGIFGLLTPDRPTGAPPVFLLPIAELTPGAMRAVSVADLCGGRREQPVPIPAALHERVFRSYGADLRQAADYELDYLITPELGGAADARNLWPQAYTHTPWNAFVKDELERSLHQDVCDGTIELAAAQQQMAGDWISAYKRRFSTDKPLRDYDLNPLTAVDRELLLSELEELGVAPPAVHADGSGLLALFQATRRGLIVSTASIN